jgi:hypothetical protein
MDLSGHLGTRRDATTRRCSGVQDYLPESLCAREPTPMSPV